MRAHRAALAALLGVVLVGCASTPEPAAPPLLAERPIYELGEKWIRNDGLYELTRIEENRYVFSGPGREIHLTRDLVVSAVTGVRFLEFVSPPSLNWPLQVGQRGGSVGSIRFYAENYGFLNMAGSSWTTLTVDAYEDVRVPAGIFKAFRISGVIGGGVRDLGGRAFRAWYAPEARQLVKAESLALDPLNFQVVAFEPSQQTQRAPLTVTLEEPADQA